MPVGPNGDPEWEASVGRSHQTTIVHVIPAGVYGTQYQGSYKDTISRVRFLERLDAEYRQVLLDDDTPDAVLAALRGQRDIRVLVEYSHYPRVVRALRRAHPDALIAIRSHNIEPLQHLDNHGLWPKRGPLWMAYGMARLALADLICKRHANAVYSISDWENRVYWDRLPGKARVEWLPYYCPGHLAPEARPFVEERGTIVCLPNSQKNRKSWDLATRFGSFAKHAKSVDGSEYDFLMTGDLADWDLPASAHVTQTGLIKDLPSLLGKAKAVCMLSPLGYGFKTTIADAIAHGCYVLAHPALARRCPDLLRPAIIPVDTAKPETFRSALSKLGAPFPVSNVNATLREGAHRILARDFGLSGS